MKRRSHSAITNSMPIAGLLAAACLWSVQSAVGEDGPDVFAFDFYRKLHAPPIVSSTLGMFELDVTLLSATDDGFTNLRVLDETGADVPFIVRTRKGRRTVSQELDVQMTGLPAEQMNGPRNEMILERTEVDAVPTALILGANRKDFVKEVSVYGSPDCTSWDAVASRVPFLDASDPVPFRNDRIEFAPADFRYFKIEVTPMAGDRLARIPGTRSRSGDPGDELAVVEPADTNAAPFRIDTIRFVRTRDVELDSEPVVRTYPVRGLNVWVDDSRKESVVTVRAGRSPLTSLRLFTRDENFCRAVSIQGSPRGAEDGVEEWIPVCTGVLCKLDLGDFRREFMTVSFPKPSRFARYRIDIRNGDNPPIAVYGVKAEGEVLEAVFPCAANHEYRVVYGGLGGGAPANDLSARLVQTRDIPPAVFTLSAQHPIPKRADPAVSGQPSSSPDHGTPPPAGHRAKTLPPDAPQAPEGRRLLATSIFVMVCALIAVLAIAVRDLYNEKRGTRDAED